MQGARTRASRLAEAKRLILPAVPEQRDKGLGKRLAGLRRTIEDETLCVSLSELPLIATSFAHMESDNIFSEPAWNSTMMGDPRNRLLAILTPEDLQWLEPQLECMQLSHGEVLAEEGEPLQHTYFPQSAVVSLVRTLKDGQVAEMATFGREGLVGLAFEGIPLQSFGRYIVQIPGTALRIDTTSLHKATVTRPAIRNMILHYTEILMSLTLQSAACNAAHSVEARAGRWIIATCDRVNRQSIPLTHEFLAEMLGVQRSTVSTILHGFQTRGLIHQGRGSITVIDRPRLQQAACECYGALRARYEKLLPVAGVSARAQPNAS
jgi:CRP-like cAMP-binding protein